jgi:excisionase family DNA binding protein
MEKLLTVDEAAYLLCLKPSTIYSYICRRKIPYIKIESSVRFRESDLMVFIKERTVKPFNEMVSISA